MKQNDLSLMIAALTRAPSIQTVDAIADCLWELHQKVRDLETQVAALRLKAAPFKSFSGARRNTRHDHGVSGSEQGVQLSRPEPNLGQRAKRSAASTPRRREGRYAHR